MDGGPDLVQFILGVLVTGLGWWIALLTSRVADLAERLARLEGTVKEWQRNTQSGKNSPPITTEHSSKEPE